MGRGGAGWEGTSGCRGHAEAVAAGTPTSRRSGSGAGRRTRRRGSATPASTPGPWPWPTASAPRPAPSGRASSPNCSTSPVRGDAGTRGGGAGTGDRGGDAGHDGARGEVALASRGTWGGDITDVGGRTRGAGGPGLRFGAAGSILGCQGGGWHLWGGGGGLPTSAVAPWRSWCTRDGLVWGGFGGDGVGFGVSPPRPPSLSPWGPGPMEEAERQWRLEFHRWSSYMMRWKSQFEHYSRQERCHQL